MISSIKEGISYIRHQSIVRTLILLVASTSLFGMSLGTLIPAWSVKILHGDAATNGFLFSSRGIGSLLGALVIASLGRASIRGKLILSGSIFFPIFIALFALVHWLPLSLVLIGCVGISTIMVASLSNAVIQSLVPDALRGRVMGVFSTIFMGSMPIGALILGSIAEQTGEAQAAIVSASAAFLVACLVLLLVPKIRSLE
jgi:MFS family permease